MLHILNYILSKKVKKSLIRLMNRMSASSLKVCASQSPYCNWMKPARLFPHYINKSSG